MEIRRRAVLLYSTFALGATSSLVGLFDAAESSWFFLLVGASSMAVISLLLFRLSKLRRACLSTITTLVLFAFGWSGYERASDADKRQRDEEQARADILAGIDQANKGIVAIGADVTKSIVSTEIKTAALALAVRSLDESVDSIKKANASTTENALARASVALESSAIAYSKLLEAARQKNEHFSPLQLNRITQVQNSIKSATSMVESFSRPLARDELYFSEMRKRDAVALSTWADRAYVLVSTDGLGAALPDVVLGEANKVVRIPMATCGSDFSFDVSDNEMNTWAAPAPIDERIVFIGLFGGLSEISFPKGAGQHILSRGDTMPFTEVNPIRLFVTWLGSANFPAYAIFLMKAENHLYTIKIECSQFEQVQDPVAIGKTTGALPVPPKLVFDPEPNHAIELSPA